MGECPEEVSLADQELIIFERRIQETDRLVCQIDNEIRYHPERSGPVAGRLIRERQGSKHRVCCMTGQANVIAPYLRQHDQVVDIGLGTMDIIRCVVNIRIEIPLLEPFVHFQLSFPPVVFGNHQRVLPSHLFLPRCRDDYFNLSGLQARYYALPADRGDGRVAAAPAEGNLVGLPFGFDDGFNTLALLDIQGHIVFQEIQGRDVGGRCRLFPAGLFIVAGRLLFPIFGIEVFFQFLRRTGSHAQQQRAHSDIRHQFFHSLFFFLVGVYFSMVLFLADTDVGHVIYDRIT